MDEEKTGDAGHPETAFLCSKGLSAEEALRERVKELNCLQKISDAVERGKDPGQIFRASLEALAHAFFYPEITCVRIHFRGQSFQTDNFSKTDWGISAEIRVNGQSEGRVEVFYLEKRPLRDEGPFLEEEINLLILCARRLGYSMEKHEISEALIKSEQRFRTLFYGMADAVFLADMETGMLMDANPAALSLTGRTRDELLAMHLSQLHPAEFEEYIKEKFQEAVKFTKAGKLFEILLRHADGRSIPVEIRTGIVLDIDGRPCITGIFRDISERKKIEKELVESTERFKALHNASFGGIAIHDKGIILDCNQGLSDMTGYALDELAGMDGLLLIAPEHRDMVMGKIIAGYEKPYEANGLRKNGESFPIRLEARNVPYKGKTVRTVEFRDITERRQAEENLLLSERTYREIFNNIPDALFIHDIDTGAILDVNESMLLKYGYTRNELSELSVAKLSAPVEPYTNEYSEKLMRRAAKGEAVVFEWLCRKKSGELFYTENILKPVFIAGIPRILAIVRDISERKLVEEALLEAKSEAEAASQAKSEFMANISHEIRTPLNGILGMMQLLKEDPLNEDQKQCISLAIGSAERLGRLLNDIIDISKIEAGKMEIQEQAFNLKEVCDSLCEIFYDHAARNNTVLSCLTDDSIPENLMGDAGRLRQILFNLIGNATKFTQGGTIRVEVHPLSQERPGYLRILFSISDTGIGIPVHRLKDLFKPFTQVDGSSARQYEGAGLGLAIVKRLVDLMDGNINIDSRPDAGTLVHFVLPFKLPGGIQGFPIVVVTD
ncbi:PAS domain S-box-containing protein [Desulfobotulus alkaliphilus]|uniref:histidine kinase n=1 Tax=Desulfobotulus alkaliphilus TaxID=622671 RepID=A0A562RHR4_9BACT|nr:PAS domain S-box protein [Desulfobotulus alkaliphilus]TWI68588.1 PAS domain S-box-containing protein [Desulfobotulus alkaliphilus]